MFRANCLRGKPCVCTRMRHGLRNAGRHDVDVDCEKGRSCRANPFILVAWARARIKGDGVEDQKGTA